MWDARRIDDERESFERGEATCMWGVSCIGSSLSVASPVARPASGVWSPVYSRLVSCRLSPRV